MPTSIRMPQLGESVTEGTVVRWLKEEGDMVAADEPLLEITTDKVNAEMPSPVAGKLLRLLVEPGAAVPVGADVALIEEESASVAPAAMSHAPSTGDRPAAADAGLQPGSPAARAEQAEHDAHRRYSPVVRKIAAEHGLDLGQVVGTGLGGRVTKEDVLAFLERQERVPAGRVTRDDVLRYVERQMPARDGLAGGLAPGPHGDLARERSADGGSGPPEAQRTMPPASAPEAGQADEERLPLSAMRKGIAEHMVRSVYTAPHATTVTEVDMTRIVRWRAANREAFKAREGVDPSYVAFVVQAVVDALKAFPLLNSSWGGDAIILRKRYNIGIAVGLDDGLLVPVIHRADERSLVGLARAIEDLASRARAGRLTIAELQGGTFTVNNTGVFGSVVSTPVINQPQAGILSMEAIVQRSVVVDEAIAIRSMMNICLSFDHRIVDGLMAGRFTQRVRHYLEGFALPS